MPPKGLASSIDRGQAGVGNGLIHLARINGCDAEIETDVDQTTAIDRGAHDPVNRFEAILKAGRIGGLLDPRQADIVDLINTCGLVGDGEAFRNLDEQNGTQLFAHACSDRTETLQPSDDDQCRIVRGKLEGLAIGKARRPIDERMALAPSAGQQVDGECHNRRQQQGNKGQTIRHCRRCACRLLILREIPIGFGAICSALLSTE